MFWGVKQINKDSVTLWDPEELGTVEFDESFDLSPVEAQQSILDLCQKLRNQTFVASSQVTCWIEDFDSYIKEKFKSTKILKRFNPVT